MLEPYGYRWYRAADLTNFCAVPTYRRMCMVLDRRKQADALTESDWEAGNFLWRSIMAAVYDGGFFHPVRALDDGFVVQRIVD